MGCAVQIHKRSERRGTWAANSVDRWYLRTSPEHYQCHLIYVKHTRSERVSDTVHFKHKHIMQPTLTPEDTIVKALNDLTHALKERRNTKGTLEIEALQKIDELLNKIPSPTIPDEATPPTTEKRVTFDQTFKPPKKMQPTPRVSNNKPTPRVFTPLATITNATIDKPIQTNTPNPKANIETWKEPSFEQTKLHQKIRDVRNHRARITQQTHMQLRQQKQCKQIQLIRDNDTGEYLNYRQLIRDPKHQKIWNTSAANEFGQLAEGVGSRVKATNTIFFIPKDKVPKDRMKDVMYRSFSCNLKPNKAETHQTRLTAGGDRINYPNDFGTPAADMTLVKILLSSIISTKGAKCVMLDMKDFYLNTPMKRYKYLHLKLSNIPKEILIKYKLREITTLVGYVYCEIRKGMYGLPQAGIIAQELLQKGLAKVGYH